MLGEFLDRQQRPVPPEPAEFSLRTVEAFGNAVDFLRNPDRFPNRKINDLMELLSQLINREIPVQPSRDVQSITFSIPVRGKIQYPVIRIPYTYLRQVVADPVYEACGIVMMASQCRDYHLGKIRPDNGEEIFFRSRAYEAEALLSFSRMADEERFILEMNDYQKELLVEFENGLASARRGLEYPTPPYKLPPSPGNN